MKAHILIVLVCAACLTACGNDSKHRNLKKYVSKVHNRQAQPIEALPKIVAIQQYKYPEETARNPFKPASRAMVAAVKGGPNLKREKEPLEGFPLDSLEYVGRMTQRTRQWAILTAPDGIAYRVAIGEHVGKHFGRVAKINADEIEIIEKILVGDKWEKRPIKMKLVSEEKK